MRSGSLSQIIKNSFSLDEIDKISIRDFHRKRKEDFNGLSNCLYSACSCPMLENFKL